MKDALHLRGRYPAIVYGSSHLVEELSGKEICTISRTWKEDELLLIWNTTDETRTLDLADTEYASDILAEMLCVSEDRVTQSETRLTLPPFGVAILCRDTAIMETPEK